MEPPLNAERAGQITLRALDDRLVCAYENAVPTGRGAKDKQHEADLALPSGANRKVNRFTPIEPSEVTGEPTKPNRAALIMQGVFGVTGADVGHLALGTFFCKGLCAAQTVTGAPPLGLIANGIICAQRLRCSLCQSLRADTAAVCGIVRIVGMHLYTEPLGLRWPMLTLQPELHRPMATLLQEPGGSLWSA